MPAEPPAPGVAMGGKGFCKLNRPRWNLSAHTGLGLHGGQVESQGQTEGSFPGLLSPWGQRSTHSDLSSLLPWGDPLGV